MIRHNHKVCATKVDPVLAMKQANALLTKLLQLLHISDKIVQIPGQYTYARASDFILFIPNALHVVAAILAPSRHYYVLCELDIHPRWIMHPAG